MSKLFQIYEEDLATLERELPRLLEDSIVQLDNARRVKWRTVQQILLNVRWNYGPPSEVVEIKAGEDMQP